MKKSLLLFIIISILGCISNERSKSKELHDFDEFLGGEKAEAFNDAEDCFYNLLNENYDAQIRMEEKIERFLQDLADDCELDENLKFNRGDITNLIKVFEESGLRKEIWIYSNEKYSGENDLSSFLTEQKSDTVYQLSEEQMELALEPEMPKGKGLSKLPFKKQDGRILHTNIKGDYLYGLAKFARQKPYIQNYVDVRARGNDISLCLISKDMIENADLSDPIMQRIIVADIFFPIIYYRSVRKE